MGKAIYSSRDKMKAMLIQSELQSEGIETIVVYGNPPGSSPTFIDPFAVTGLDSNWQIVAHNEDVQKATDFLKSREK